MTQYPRDILDTPEALLALLGSFWTGYDGADTVASIMASRAALDRQTNVALQRLLDGMSRKTVPISTFVPWTGWPIRAADANNGYAVRRFGSAGVFDSDGDATYGGTVGLETAAWKLPDGVETVAFVSNRITHASLTLVRDVDFIIDDGYLVFRVNPFAVPEFPIDNGDTDPTILLWLGKAEHDDRLISRQFGYALGLDRPSTPQFLSMVNALLDGITQGTTTLTVRRTWAAAAGLPLVETDGEVVEAVDITSLAVTVITDKTVYVLPPGSVPTVVVGQILAAGDTLDDALEFFEPGGGQTPSTDFLSMLSLGDGFLSAGLFGELVFRNADVPLIAWREADGRTKVRFELGGWPADVDKFFDDAHDRAGVSIADALDLRPVSGRVEPAGPENLPKTVNPLALLCQHVLRDNAVLLRIRPESFPAGLDAEAAKLLRRVMPPQTVIIVIGRLVGSEQPVTMDGPGTETAPGYDEAVSVFDAVSVSETIAASSYVSENVRLVGIGGHCV